MVKGRSWLVNSSILLYVLVGDVPAARLGEVKASSARPVNGMRSTNSGVIDPTPKSGECAPARSIPISALLEFAAENTTRENSAGAIKGAIQ